MIQCSLQVLLNQPSDIFIWDHSKRFFSACTFSCVIQPTLYFFLFIASVCSIPSALKRRTVTADNVSSISLVFLPGIHLWQLICIFFSDNMSLDSNFCVILKASIGFVTFIVFIIGGGGISMFKPKTIGQKFYAILYIFIMILNAAYVYHYWDSLLKVEIYFSISLVLIMIVCVIISGICLAYARKHRSYRDETKTIIDYIVNFFFLKGFPLLYNGTRKFSRLKLLEPSFILSRITTDINVELLMAYFDKHYRLMKEVLRLYGMQIFWLGGLYLIHIGNSFAKAVILERLITAFSNNQDPTTIAIISSLLIFSCTLCFLTDTYYNYHTSTLVISIEISLQKLMYKYVLDSTITGNSDEKVGKVCSILSTDLKRFSNIVQCLHPLVWSPVQIIVGFYLLYRNLGVTFLVGVFIAACMIPFNHAISSRIQKLAGIILEYKDTRMKIVSELLQKFVGIKIYGWDEIFYSRILDVRQNELKYLKERKYLDALCVVSWATLTTIVSFSSFATYSFLGNELSASKVFGSIAVFNILLIPMNALPWYINGIIEAVVSEKRVSEFLFDLKCHAVSNPVIISNRYYLSLQKCFFSWTSTMDSPTLRDITISLMEGELLGITGDNASGKSSVLMSFANKLHMSSGNFYMRSNSLIFSIAPQNPWIYEGTLKDNILMGSEFNFVKYEKVLKACCLDLDIKSFPNGDYLLISHNGINLSGGQKTRIALARCLYKDADIYLLDDPLKDVDSIVAHKIMKNAFLDYLRGKTRILCFTDVSYSNLIPRIIVLEGGKIKNIKISKTALTESNNDTSTNINLRSVTVSDENSFNDYPMEEDDYQHHEGYVKASVYWKYARSIGPWCLLLLFASPVLLQVSLQSTNSWLSYLVSYWPNYTLISRRNSMIIYCELVGFTLLFAFLRAFSFAYGTFVASKKIHDSFLRSVIKRPATCVDEVAISDTVNRFSTDLYGIDYQLPFILNILMASVFSFVGTMTVILSSAPYFIMVAIPLFILCVIVQIKYRKFASFLKRIIINDLTPIYNGLIETIVGCRVIDIMESKGWFYSRFQGYIIDYVSSQYTLCYMQQWLSLTMNAFGLIMIIGILIIINLMNFYGRGETFLVHLSVSYLMQLTSSISSLFSSFIYCDQHMIHAERIFGYSFHDKVQVPINETNKVYVDHNLSYSDILEFRNVVVKYYNGFCPYPDGLNIKFKRGSTIGICGTTGAGKSSIFKSLFGLAPVVSGEIILCGVSFRKYTRKQLNKICYILPQDPVVFDNSIRFNLDPTNEFTDEQLLKVLEQSEISYILEMNHANLYSEIGPEGLTLTHGQKQLLCLARALLHNPQIIFFDEATSSADKQTDEKMWNVIFKHFRDSTVIIIAHRLSNILSADKIVVLEKGKVLEYDDPEELLRNQSSRFSKLMKLQIESI